MGLVPTSEPDRAWVKSVLVVDDDQTLREALAEHFRPYNEFTVCLASSANEASGLLDNRRFDIVLLDVALPDMDGREWCRIMRRKNFNAPIIMLTAADTDADTILGLDGANDYIVKPFRPNVLLARMRAHLRTHETSEYTTTTVGPYTFMPSKKILVEYSSGKEVRLTEKETLILKHLHTAKGKAVSRKTLLDKIWRYNPDAETHTVETHVYRLRQKLECDPASAKFLVTVPEGYQLLP